MALLRPILMSLSLAFALSAITTCPVLAQSETRLSPADEILVALQSHGYRIVINERTWLGRQRILAEKDGASREVVFIPGTGEILRDYSVRLGGAGATRLAGDGHEGNGGATSTAAASPGLSVGNSLTSNSSADTSSVRAISPP